MKPAPATSARATSALAGSACTIACASSRGLRRAAFARRSAMLVAKSPCAASRVRSISTCVAASAGREPAGSAARAPRTSSTSCSFIGAGSSREALIVPSRVRGGRSERLLEYRSIGSTSSDQWTPCGVGSRSTPRSQEPRNFCRALRVSLSISSCAWWRPARRAMDAGTGPSSPNIGWWRQCEIACGLQEPHDGGCFGRIGAQQGEPCERRPVRLRAFGERGGRETLVTALDEAAQQRVVGELGLNQHFPRPRGAAGAPRHLHDRLREPLARPEVRAEQTLVSVHDHHQRHVREVVALASASACRRGCAPHPS